jgi:hypothetical protein
VHPQDLIRFSPREVTVRPNVWQTVRIQVRKPPDLPQGEYRINLVIRAVPPPVDPDAEPEAGQRQLSVKLTPALGLSLPVIVRHGDTCARIAIVEPELDPAGAKLRFRVNRTGDQSVYGNLTVTFAPRSGPEETLAFVPGQAIYANNACRIFNLPLRPRKSGAPLAGGRLVIAYVATPEDGGKAFGQCQLDLP